MDAGLAEGARWPLVVHGVGLRSKEELPAMGSVVRHEHNESSVVGVDNRRSMPRTEGSFGWLSLTAMFRH